MHNSEVRADTRLEMDHHNDWMKGRHGTYVTIWVGKEITGSCSISLDMGLFSAEAAERVLDGLRVALLAELG